MSNAPQSAHPGFALGQIARSLTALGNAPDDTARERANAKAETWRDVLRGMLSGMIRVGSRTPLAGVPVWVTTQVAHGGFATGQLAAGGPLLPHETTRLADMPGVPAGSERAALNAHFLTDDGLAELGRLLDDGRYRVRVPEEGAMLAVAWLARNGHVAARTVLDAIAPFLDRLRFYPVTADTPAPEGPTVRVRSVGEVIGDLEGIRPSPRRETQREAITVWLPLYDRAVGLFVETLEGPPPTLARGEDGHPTRPDGKFVIEGGWPCAHYPDGWAARAAELLADYRRLRAEHRLSASPEAATSGFAVLRQALAKCAADTASMTGREVGAVRQVLAGIFTRGGPDSARHADRRARQARQTASPGTASLAKIAAARLANVPADEGLADPSVFLVPVTDAEARPGVPIGYPMPAGVCQRVARCREATVGELVDAGLVPSSEALARLLPGWTAGIRATAFADPALRRLFAAIDTAFRARRSLLLLNLESQAKLEELPWVRALLDFRTTDGQDAARAALRHVVLLAWEAFPHEIMPNKLVREVRALANAAGLRLPMTDELAADIFMGQFTEPFLLAAQTAARRLRGTLYERYYRVPFERVSRMTVSASGRRGKAVSAEFASLCNELAGRAGRANGVAGNGQVIEQQQILTTHNLAVLADGLDLTGELGRRGEGLALTCFAHICRAMRRPAGRPGRVRLREAKNIAYAWRQMVFFLAMAPANALDSFVRRATSQLEEQPDAIRGRLHRELETLARAGAGGEHPGTPLLGWCAGRHRLTE